MHTWRLKHAERFSFKVAAFAAVAFLATFLKKVCTFFAVCLAFALTGPCINSYISMTSIAAIYLSDRLQAYIAGSGHHQHECDQKGL